MHIRSVALDSAAPTLSRSFANALAREAVAIPPAGDTRDFTQAAQDHRGLPPPKRGNRFARFAPATYDAEAHTVELVLSVGADVRRWGFIERLLIDPAAVDVTRVPLGAVKVLNSHNAWDVGAILGTIVSTRFATGQLIGVCKFGETPAAVEAEGMVARGELTSVSIGYDVAVWRAVEIVADPVSGVEITVWRADEWTLLEVSFVSVPADASAGVRSADTPQSGHPSATPGGATEDDDMHMRNAPGAAAPAPAAAAAALAAAAAATPAAATRAAPAATPAEKTPSRFGATESLDFVEQGRAFGVETEARELVTKNEKGEVGVKAARGALLKAAAEKQRSTTGGNSGTAAAVVTADSRDKWMRGAMNNLLVRAGVAEIVAQAAKKRGETIDLDPGELRGMRNVQMAALALRNMGERVDMITADPKDIVGRALVYQKRDAFGGQTTSDFAVLLENTLHKVLQAAYIIAPDTWTQFCGVGSVADFRPHPRYLRGTFGALDSLTENGEFKNKPIPDGAKESITAKTKGNIVALSRPAIVNDDLGAFSNISTDLGRAAKLSIEVDVYAVLAQNSGLGPNMNDGHPLFDAAHNNIASVSAAPGVAPFDAIRQLMASQKDLSGNEYLDIRPSVWLGPLSIGGAARVTALSPYDPDASSKLQRPNIVFGLFNKIVDSPRLSGTRWYTFADPAMHPAIEVAFLDGVQEPFLEQQLGWRVDGTEWKVRLDYGVGAMNYRSAATNAGA